MVKKIEGELWDDCRDKMSLKQLFAKIPDNDLQWFVHEVWITGVAPHDMSQDEFEQKARDNPYGYQLTWSELLIMAENTWDLNDLYLIGAEEPIEYPQFYGDELIDYCAKNHVPIRYFVEAHDSTTWQIIDFN